VIHWRKWSTEVFHTARQENKPVLLTPSGAGLMVPQVAETYLSRNVSRSPWRIRI
jgi:hypothetical protein